MVGGKPMLNLVRYLDTACDVCGKEDEDEV